MNARAARTIVVVAALAAPAAACREASSRPVEPRLVVATEAGRVVVGDLARPDVAPRVLSDGLVEARGASVRFDGARVVFTAKEHAAARRAVFTCAPDGSGRVRSAEGVADCGSAAFLADGRIVFSAATGDASSALFTTDAAGAPRRITFSGGADVDPTPLPDGRIAFRSRAPGAAEFRALAVHVDGTGVGPFDGALPAVRAAAPLAPSPKPQGHLSVVDETKATGDLFCVDARAPGAAAAARVRLVRLDGGGVALGDVPLESDGSFFVRVPRDVPLGIELLDASGVVVAAQRTPFWVRPGEMRGCVGCHEDADTTPPNVRPLAVRRGPTPLAAVPIARGAR